MKDASTKIKDTDCHNLYLAYELLDTIQFRKYVREMIENARAPNLAILRKIDTQSKDQLLFTASNFALKGFGLGVK